MNSTVAARIAALKREKRRLTARLKFLRANPGPSITELVRKDIAACIKIPETLTQTNLPH